MKKIEWVCPTEEIKKLVPRPQPAKNYIPNWYKKMPKFKNNSLKILENNKANTTGKSCMPFLDSLMAGYIQETWCDIYIEIKNDKFSYNWSFGPEIITYRQDLLNESLFKNNIFYPIEFTWNQYWLPKMPKGYSMIFTHPFNRIELPFFTTSGVIDSDLFFSPIKEGSRYPFYIKNNFSGIIPAGTPMYQMIPMKRDIWQSLKNNLILDENNNENILKHRKFFYDGYKKIVWQKKDYR